MKWLLLVVLVLFIGCADSLISPYDEQLDYEPHKMKLFEDEEFGTIQDNLINVQVSDITATHITLKYPTEQYQEILISVKDTELKLIMYKKYCLTFKYHLVGNADIFLQLKQCERL